MMGMFLLSWFTGIGIGMVFLSAFTPWQPELAGILTRLYMRLNMVASGKMLLANNTSPKLRNCSTGTRCSTPSTRAGASSF
jgi:hypothetical protein